MVTTFIIVAVALLWHVSAENISTSLLIPSGLLLPPFLGPATKTGFTGVMTVTGTTTKYTVSCPTAPAFFPGPDACHSNNNYSYTFSAIAATTRFLVPNINLALNPFSSPFFYTVTKLQSFVQNATINCGPTNTASAAHCVYTTLYNSEHGDSTATIVHPTLVTQYSTETDSTFYPALFTDARVAAASSPLVSTASSTSTKLPGPATASPRTTSSSAPTTSPTSPSTPHASLSTGSKAGIGIGVPLGALALAVIALLLYRRNKKIQVSQEGTSDPSGSVTDVFEKDNDVAVPDNSGVYEMDGKRSPVQPLELEG